MSEVLLLLVVVASPWPFGSIHPPFRYYVTAGISAIMLLWAAELLIDPKSGSWTRFQWPVVGLVAIVVLQMIPLGPLLSVISPHRAALDSQLYPPTLELLANGESIEIPALSARNRISFYPAETLRRCLWIAQLGLLFTRVQSIATMGTLRRLCWACLINGGLLAFLAIAQNFTSNYQTLFWNYEAGASVFGPFINRNHFAFYMNMCCGLAVGLLGARLSAEPVFGNWLEKITAILRDSTALWIISLLFFMFGSLFLCCSRGGMGSLVLAFLVVAVGMGLSGQVGQAARWFTVGAVVIAIALGIQTWLGFDLAQSRLTDARDNRTVLWIPLLQLVAQFPIFGSGYGTLGYLEPMTRSGSSAEYFLEYAHNEYLQLAIETGLAGLACGCALLAMLVSRNARLIRETESDKFLFSGLLLCVCTMAIHSFVEFGLVIPAIAVLAVVICGHVAGVKHKPVRTRSKYGQLASRIAGLAIVAVTVVAFQQAKAGDLAHRAWLGALRARNAARELKNREYELTQQAAKDAAPDSSRAELKNLEELHARAIANQWTLSNDASRHRPTDAELRLELVRLGYEALGRTQEELLFLQSNLAIARELCPLTADAHFMLGWHASEFQRIEKPIVHYQRARQTRPMDATLAYITGVECLKADESAAAVKHLRDSLALSGEQLGAILELAIESLDNQTIEEELIPPKPRVYAACADWLEVNSGRQELVTRLRRKALELPELRAANAGDDYYLKAKLYAKLGDSEQAIQAYRNALRFDPANVAWRLERAIMLRDAGRLNEATDEVRRILLQSSSNLQAERLAGELSEELATQKVDSAKPSVN